MLHPLLSLLLPSYLLGKGPSQQSVLEGHPLGKSAQRDHPGWVGDGGAGAAGFLGAGQPSGERAPLPSTADPPPARGVSSCEAQFSSLLDAKQKSCLPPPLPCSPRGAGQKQP